MRANSALNGPAGLDVGSHSGLIWDPCAGLAGLRRVESSAALPWRTNPEDKRASQTQLQGSHASWPANSHASPDSASGPASASGAALPPLSAWQPFAVSCGAPHLAATAAPTAVGTAAAPPPQRGVDGVGAAAEHAALRHGHGPASAPPGPSRQGHDAHERSRSPGASYPTCAAAIAAAAAPGADALTAAAVAVAAAPPPHSAVGGGGLHPPPAWWGYYGPPPPGLHPHLPPPHPHLARRYHPHPHHGHHHHQALLRPGLPPPPPHWAHAHHNHLSHHNHRTAAAYAFRHATSATTSPYKTPPLSISASSGALPVAPEAEPAPAAAAADAAAGGPARHKRAVSYSGHGHVPYSPYHRPYGYGPHVPPPPPGACYPPGPWDPYGPYGPPPYPPPRYGPAGSSAFPPPLQPPLLPATSSHQSSPLDPQQQRPSMNRAASWHPGANLPTAAAVAAAAPGANGGGGAATSSSSSDAPAASPAGAAAEPPPSIVHPMSWSTAHAPAAAAVTQPPAAAGACPYKLSNYMSEPHYPYSAYYDMPYYDMAPGLAAGSGGGPSVYGPGSAAPGGFPAGGAAAAGWRAAGHAQGRVSDGNGSSTAMVYPPWYLGGAATASAPSPFLASAMGAEADAGPASAAATGGGGGGSKGALAPTAGGSSVVKVSSCVGLSPQDSWPATSPSTPPTPCQQPLSPPAAHAPSLQPQPQVLLQPQPGQLLQPQQLRGGAPPADDSGAKRRRVCPSTSLPLLPCGGGAGAAGAGKVSGLTARHGGMGTGLHDHSNTPCEPRSRMPNGSEVAWLNFLSGGDDASSGRGAAAAGSPSESTATVTATAADAGSDGAFARSSIATVAGSGPTAASSCLSPAAAAAAAAAGGSTVGGCGRLSTSLSGPAGCAVSAAQGSHDAVLSVTGSAPGNNGNGVGNYNGGGYNHNLGFAVRYDDDDDPMEISLRAQSHMFLDQEAGTGAAGAGVAGDAAVGVAAGGDVHGGLQLPSCMDALTQQQQHQKQQETPQQHGQLNACLARQAQQQQHQSAAAAAAMGSITFPSLHMPPRQLSPQRAPQPNRNQHAHHVEQSLAALPSTAQGVDPEDDREFLARVAAGFDDGTLDAFDGFDALDLKLEFEELGLGAEAPTPTAPTPSGAVTQAPLLLTADEMAAAAAMAAAGGGGAGRQLAAAAATPPPRGASVSSPGGSTAMMASPPSSHQAPAAVPPTASMPPAAAHFQHQHQHLAAPLGVGLPAAVAAAIASASASSPTKPPLSLAPVAVDMTTAMPAVDQAAAATAAAAHGTSRRAAIGNGCHEPKQLPPTVNDVNAEHLPGPVRVTVAGGSLGSIISAAISNVKKAVRGGGAAASGRRRKSSNADSDEDEDDGRAASGERAASSAAAAAAAAASAAATTDDPARDAAEAAAVGGKVVGVFHVLPYLEGGKCIEYDGELISRSAFERVGGSTMAKWYRSIKVLPDGMSLGRWLAAHKLPILKGNPRRSFKGRRDRAGEANTPALAASGGASATARGADGAVSDGDYC